MANSSFFKNTGTSSQLQGSASASAAAALASEQAAAASQTAASTSETNSAASAAASATSAAQSLSSANSSAASQSNAATSEANALASSTNAQDWAVKTTGLVDSTDYASKAWAIGGTGVTGGSGASKEWSTHLGSTVDGSDYSAKHYSQVAASEAADAAADAVATAADRVQTGLDVVAAAGSATAASNSQIAAASSAAAAAATLDTFDDRYLGSYASDPTVDNDGNALVTGALYFNTTANEMRVYDGGNWIAASSAGGASLINYHYTATAAQTTFSGSDDNSRTLSYTVDNLIVTRNGVVLEDGTDYTATNGTSVVLAAAAAAGDEINVVAFKSFTTADMVSATNGGAFQGNVDFAAGIDVTGNVTVTGTVDGRDVAADGTKLDGIETGATADQTGAEIKASYEAEANTNAYTDAEKTKLTGIEALADVTDDTNVRAAGAVMTTGVSTLADSAYFKGAPTHGFRFNNNSDAYNNFIIRENGNTYTRGNAGIGTSSPSSDSKLHILAAGTAQIRMDSTGTATGDGSFIRYMKGGTDIAYIGIAGPILGSTSNDTLLYSNGVNNMLFFTNGAERLRIDASGRVTMPYQPAFHVYRTTNVASGSYINHNVYPVNNGGHYNSTNGKFTAPVAGHYMFYATGLTQPTGLTSRMKLVKNGSTYVSGESRHQGGTAGAYLHATIQAVVYLAAGDWVQQFYFNDDGSTTLYSDSTPYITFGGHLIG